MFVVMADWIAVPLLYHDYLGKPTPRVGVNHTVICPRGAYRCRDGQLAVITVQHAGEWNRISAWRQTRGSTTTPRASGTSRKSCPAGQPRRCSRRLGLRS